MVENDSWLGIPVELSKKSHLRRFVEIWPALIFLSSAIATVIWFSGEYEPPDLSEKNEFNETSEDVPTKKGESEGASNALLKAMNELNQFRSLAEQEKSHREKAEDSLAALEQHLQRNVIMLAQAEGQITAAQDKVKSLERKLEVLQADFHRIERELEVEKNLRLTAETEFKSERNRADQAQRNLEQCKMDNYSNQVLFNQTDDKSNQKQKEKWKITIGAGVNLRNDPKTSASKSVTIHFGTIGQVLEVISQEETWYKISFNDDNKGWISGNFVTDIDINKPFRTYIDIAKKKYT